jgi:hypothetical protein
MGKSRMVWLYEAFRHTYILLKRKALMPALNAMVGIRDY